MPARGKIESVAPAVISGPALFSALRNIWNGSSAANEKESRTRLVSHGPDFGNLDWPTGLHTLVNPLVVIRRRILTNAFLGGWMKVWTWILTGLIVAAAFSPKLTWAWVSAAALIAIGAVAVGVLTWRGRPSARGPPHTKQLAGWIRPPAFTTESPRRSTWEALRIPMG